MPRVCAHDGMAYRQQKLHLVKKIGDRKQRQTQKTVYTSFRGSIETEYTEISHRAENGAATW